MSNNQVTVVSSSGNASVSINGETYTGSTVTMSNGSVIVDGVKQDKVTAQRVMITINGDVDSVSSTDGTIIMHGDAKTVRTTNGDVECENVTGDVTTTNGDVDAWDVAGNVSTTNGDITHK